MTDGTATGGGFEFRRDREKDEADNLSGAARGAAAGNAPVSEFGGTPKDTTGSSDGRNRIGGCCGCGCLAAAAFLVCLMLFYWLLLPPLNWITGGFFCSGDLSEEAADSRWLQKETASGFLPGLEDELRDEEYPIPLPPPPEPVMPVFDR